MLWSSPARNLKERIDKTPSKLPYNTCWLAESDSSEYEGLSLKNMRSLSYALSVVVDLGAREHFSVLQL